MNASARCTNVTALHPGAAPRGGHTQGNPAQALNALWLRLDQARTVALCIPVHCEDEHHPGAMAQAVALAGALAQVLSAALADVAALEAMV
jgi:hypothetical protein